MRMGSYLKQSLVLFAWNEAAKTHLQALMGAEEDAQQVLIGAIYSSVGTGLVWPSGDQGLFLSTFFRSVDHAVSW